MSPPEITIHHVTSIKIIPKTIKGPKTQDVGYLTITIINDNGEALELTCFVEDHEEFKLNVAGIERGLHFV
jgi:hypothetical protein